MKTEDKSQEGNKGKDAGTSGTDITAHLLSRLKPAKQAIDPKGVVADDPSKPDGAGAPAPTVAPSPAPKSARALRGRTPPPPPLTAASNPAFAAVLVRAGASQRRLFGFSSQKASIFQVVAGKTEANFDFVCVEGDEHWTPLREASAGEETPSAPPLKPPAVRNSRAAANPEAATVAANNSRTGHRFVSFTLVDEDEDAVLGALLPFSAPTGGQAPRLPPEPASEPAAVEAILKQVRAAAERLPAHCREHVAFVCGLSHNKRTVAQAQLLLDAVAGLKLPGRE
jgi:hypothetical protein